MMLISAVVLIVVSLSLLSAGEYSDSHSSIYESNDAEAYMLQLYQTMMNDDDTSSDLTENIYSFEAKGIVIVYKLLCFTLFIRVEHIYIYIITCLLISIL